ncbi:hypothetical protein ACX6XY_08830 [Streptomyces sp. O3]
MRSTSLAAAIALGALVGGFTASSAVAAAPEIVQQGAVASAATATALTSAAVATEDNHGNG